MVKKCVDDIWSKYDIDHSNALDKEETKNFIKFVLKELDSGSDSAFDEADFEACFKEFDSDGNGTISREEMANFIKSVAGIR